MFTFVKSDDCKLPVDCTKFFCLNATYHYITVINFFSLVLVQIFLVNQNILCSALSLLPLIVGFFPNIISFFFLDSFQPSLFMNALGESQKFILKCTSLFVFQCNSSRKRLMNCSQCLVTLCLSMDQSHDGTRASEVVVSCSN